MPRRRRDQSLAIAELDRVIENRAAIGALDEHARNRELAVCGVIADVEILRANGDVGAFGRRAIRSGRLDH